MPFLLHNLKSVRNYINQLSEVFRPEMKLSSALVIMYSCPSPKSANGAQLQILNINAGPHTAIYLSKKRKIVFFFSRNCKWRIQQRFVDFCKAAGWLTRPRSSVSKLYSLMPHDKVQTGVNLIFHNPFNTELIPLQNERTWERLNPAEAQSFQY